jgi:hypothetical protein
LILRALSVAWQATDLLCLPHISDHHQVAYGPGIKNDEQYEALKNKRMSKEKAARIANTPDSGRKGGKSAK